MTEASQHHEGASIALSAITDDPYFDGADFEVPPPAALCGRIKEIKKLHDVFDGVLETKRPAVVAVHGVSGSGKTALVDTLREKVMNNGGYFCAGKFFQNSNLQEPYSAILAAYSDLCDLIVQSDGFDDDRRRHIRRRMWPDGPMLTRAVSTLSHLIGSGDADDDCEAEHQSIVGESNEASFARFKNACKTFLRGVSSEDHPIVLFIDDIQWMDKGSRQLIEMLLQKTSDLTNIMLVLSYRDEEADKVQSLFQKETSTMEDVVDISLTKLDVASVHEMVCCFTGMASESSGESVWELSELIAKRTRGNPFHVMVFLETIHFEGLLTSEENSHECMCDLTAIQSEMMVSEESVDLLQRKIKHLPHELKEVLKVASLVGYRFAETIVSEVASIVILDKLGKPYDSGLLAKAVELSFIEVTSTKSNVLNVTYNFTHDKMQAVFQSMANDVEASRLHLLIGEAFLSGGIDSLSMYNAAVHLDHVPSYLENPEKRSVLARINLGASKYCSEKSAFAKAAAMLRRGLDVSGLERWTEDNFDLTFEMTEALAKAEFVVGHFDASRMAAEETLQRSKSIEMMINSLVIDLELKMVTHDKEIYSTATRALRTLEVAKMPRKVLSHHVLLKFLSLKRRLGRLTDAEILSLPITNNERVRAAVLLLSHVSVYGFYQDEPNISAYTALLAGELTLDVGLSPWSAIAFIFLGILELSMHNYDGGRRFEALSWKVIELVKGEKKEATIPTSLMALAVLSHNMQPLNQLTNRMIQVSNLSLELGDVVYGCVGLSGACGMMFCYGKHLNQLDRMMRLKYDYFCNLDQQDQLIWMLPTMQLVVNLKSTDGDSCSLTRLTGEFINEDAYMIQIGNIGHQLLIALALLQKAILCSFFGRFDVAQLYFKHMSKSGDIPHIAWSAYYQNFFGAVAYIETYRESGNRRLLWGVRKFKKRLELSEKTGNPNAVPLAIAVRALQLSLNERVKTDVLAQSFAHATSVLRDSGLVHIEGLLNKRAGFVFASRGCCAEAVHHFDRALEIFLDDWGAIAVYEWLERTSSAALGRFPQCHSTTAQPLVGGVIEYDTIDSPE